MNFLNHKYARLLTLVLLVQATVYYAAAFRSELVPDALPLAFFPMRLGDWHMVKEYPVDPEVEKILKADDQISRVYVNASGADASLFIAFFKTQRYGQTPHTPKVCLPGAGWEPIENTTMPIDVPGWTAPIVANRYVVVHGEDKVLTIYWYQTHNRVIASDYAARFWLIADAIRYRRSDTSIVRVIVPVRDNNLEKASQTGVSFIQTLFPSLLKQLPA